MKEVKRWLFIAFLLIFWLGVLYLFVKPPSNDVKMPAREAGKALPSAQITALPSPTVSTGQTPRSEREPHESQYPDVTIYVVDAGISPIWALDSAITGWKKAKWTDIIKVKACPVARPCVTVAEKRLAKDEAGQTNFGYRVEDNTIYLNSSLIWEPFEAQSTLAHEFGHILGAPHIKGTANTLMTEVDGFYRTKPTTLDLKVVDDLGPWELEKMYESSGKTLDVRNQPK